MLRAGQRVSVLATTFDGKNDNSWSISQFGDQWQSAWCYGVIKNVIKSKNCASVLWDIDRNVTKICLDALRVENEKRSDLPGSSKEVSSPLRNMENIPISRKEISSEYPTSSSESDTDDSSSSSSQNDDPELTDDTLQPNADTFDIPDPNDVTVHDTTWHFNTAVQMNAFKESRFKPKLHVHNLQDMKEIDFWMIFFPSEEIDYILECTNANLRERRKVITKGDFYKVIGFMYAMTLSVCHTRREYWSTESGLFPAPAFGKRFGMELHRFEEILGCISFSRPDNENDDKWHQVRSFFEIITSKWSDIFTPGYKITVDESMFAWYGKGLYKEEGGMPAVIKIKRKPKGVGCEAKTIADVTSGIMIGIEINEGKQAMQQKEWQRELGAGTATTLRLTRPWHGTGRIVVGDSWFSSVKTATELQKKGLYYVGIVKTATKNYPIVEAKKRCPETRGHFLIATAQNPDANLICAAWKDKTIHTFIGTCGTSLDGTPAKKRRMDVNGRIIIKEVPRPQIVEEYFDAAPSIDIHNHIRQSGLALEQVWNTQRWEHRMFASLFGIIETNAFLAYKYFKRDSTIKHSYFTQALAQQLIKNNWCNDNQDVSQDDVLPAAVPERRPQGLPQMVGDHTLVALSRDDERKRVQRKCIICSRVRKVQQKASYRCSNCGIRAVMCAPTTGRNCFTYHIQHGIPA